MKPQLPSGKSQSASLFGFFVLSFTAAGIGGLATASSVSDWYQTLARPAWGPPDWLFGPVWTMLFALMAIAGWLVWRSAGWRESRTALVCFVVQLILNSCWSIIFFGLRQPGWACVEILFLWTAIAITIAMFYPRSPIAAWLLSPYLAWTSFAAVLNFTIWRMNA